MLAGLRARLAARPDTEHEQGILRLVIGALLISVVSWALTVFVGDSGRVSRL